MDPRTIRFLRSLALLAPLTGGLACERTPEPTTPAATSSPSSGPKGACRCEDETYSGAPEAICHAGEVDAKGKLCPHKYLPGGPLPPPDLVA